MYTFDFMNFDSECVYTVSSPKRFLMLREEANLCLCTDETCAVDSHQDYIDEIDLDSNNLGEYGVSDTVLLRVDSEAEANSELFNNPDAIKCKVVVCGDYVDHLPEGFKAMCHSVTSTCAEPTEDDYAEDDEEGDYDE